MDRLATDDWRLELPDWKTTTSCPCLYEDIVMRNWQEFPGVAGNRKLDGLRIWERVWIDAG